MRKKEKIVLGIGLVIIVALVVFIAYQMKQRTAKNVVQEAVNPFIPVTSTGSSTATSTMPRDWEETPDRLAVPTGVVVPEPGMAVPAEIKDKVAIPNQVVEEPAGTKIRTFNLRAEGGKFIPETFIANQGDQINIQFTSVDGDYDLVLSGYNMKQTAKKGETKTLAFQAYQDGRFPYYCAACGGLDGTAKGEFIIVKK